MVVSLEEAFTIVNKWKDESARILVVAESPFRQYLRGVDEPGVHWAMGIRGKVSRVAFSPLTKGSNAGIVVFEGPSANLALSIGHCSFVYEEPREAQPVIRGEAEFATLSALSIFFPSSEAFIIYELQNC